MLNFNDYINNRTNRQYIGSTDIQDIAINGDAYLLKMQSKIVDPDENETSYRNNCVSEFLGCKIFKMLNIPVQEVILGIIDLKDKEKIAVACKDLRNSNEELNPFRSMRSPFFENPVKYPFKSLELNTTLNNIQNLKLNNVNNNDILKRFWEQFIVDAFIGNYDRHNGNWGYILNLNTNTSKICPVYDCGASFDSKLSKETMEKYLNNNNELKNHILNDQNSALRINGSKIIYYDFFNNSNYKDFYEALNNIFPKINMDNIKKLINETEGIDDIHKEYYKKMLEIKYEHLLKKTYKRINSNINLLSSDTIKEKNYKILNEEKNKKINDTVINHKKFGDKNIYGI